ncbi:RidA family protein [Sphingobium sp. AN558]|uniref:RidA family protein n=1 Tax=Sphingobium sp. AN558 TaxID=3133442 RepID=UPI0030C0FAE0
MKMLVALLASFAALPASAQPTPTIPARLPYSPSVRAGDTLYISGQIGQIPVGMDPHKEGFEAAVKAAMDSIGKILAASGLDFGHVVKCTVMLDDMADWPRFNTIYTPYFAGKRLPARSAFGTDGLALGAPVEVECIATFAQ